MELASDAELAALPPAALDCMSFHGVAPSKPKHWSFRMGFTGRFRMGPDRPWMPIEAVQYNTRLPVVRIFHMSARMKGILPVLARDTYAEGRGRLLARIGNLVTVADGRGPEFDMSELVTWVGDCVLAAPSMLLGPSTRWSHIDARSFEVAFSDHGRTVTARVSVDARGAPINFETTDRFLYDSHDRAHRLIRCRWSTPVESWGQVGALAYPAFGKAIWHLPRGDFTYAEFELVPDTLAYDIPPVTPQARP